MCIDIPDIPLKERLIVALDVNTNMEALDIVKKLGDDVTYYKVGWQLFFAGAAYDLIKDLAHMGKKVFLDLKMEDIGTTIELAMKNAPVEFVDYVELLTLKGSSAGDLVEAAKRGAEASKLKFLMLTVLSSVDDADIKAYYGDQMTLDKLIHLNAKTALAAKCDGLIASGESIRNLRKDFGDGFYIVAPGIRPEGFSTDDHKRSLTPYDAISFGANYLVVGRPITQSDNPSKVASSVISDIDRALNDKKATASGSIANDNDEFQSMAQAM
jgi:orotidine-5'-phosphate decarboxylase